MNKKKIINDPIYGFVTIPSELVFDLMQHRYFQRLRYIKQVSLTHLVYPGALHTRFQHAIGAMHLMTRALNILSGKGISISEEEREGALAAILLHDIGHGPFSHSLEHTLIEEVSHEMLSSILMDKLNEEFGGKLDLAISIFTDNYPRHFLHKLVSSHLDTDRMDYLIRDSFYTGVSEGVISFDRIIKMLNVVDDDIVVESKGIYSIENFLVARRLMYWQVYFHKAVISAEQMLIKALKRAKYLQLNGKDVFATPALHHFLAHKITEENFLSEEEHLDYFTQLDDMDIMSGIKVWAHHDDQVLSTLCRRLMERNLFRTEIRNEPLPEVELKEIEEKVIRHFKIKPEDVHYFVIPHPIQNSAYDTTLDKIKILQKNGDLEDIATASDLSNLESLTKRVQKHTISYPKELKLPND
ncbi:MAG TPA: HD domain-containing protein [Sphingobacterium sp.]|nr:HD domain-containing protein [Sphingobacterium sp.]